MEKGYAVSKGINIYYEIYGKAKETLVFLHGNGESSVNFEKSALFFEKDFRVLLVDSRCHGGSGTGGDPLTINNMADDLYAVFNHLRIPKASVIGFSDGANIAMVFAGKHTERVDKLVLFGGNINNNGVKLSFQIPVAISYMLAKMAAHLDENAKNNADLLSLMAVNQHIDENIIKNIKNKTLVMAGEKDMVKKKHTEKIANLIPNAQLKIIKGADHFYPYRNNDVFNEDIKKFVSE